jgi:hypothetical protein
MSVYDICEEFGNITFAEKMTKLVESGKQPVYNIDSFINGTISYLEDKKEVLVTKVKIKRGGSSNKLF